MIIKNNEKTGNVHIVIYKSREEEEKMKNIKDINLYNIG
jgi:hypothetical protein